jgi:hypothetical protein
MKLGQIKLQALSLISPELAIECDEDKVSDAIYAMRVNSNASSYLIASVGAINRAFAQIECRLLSGIQARKFDLSKSNFSGGVISIDFFDEILKINQVKINGVLTDFEMVGGGKIKVDYHSIGGECEVTYHKKIKRINLATENDYEISLGGIEEYIPHYVRWELLSSDGDEECEKSRDVFEKALDFYSGIVADTILSETVYSVRRI